MLDSAMLELVTTAFSDLKSTVTQILAVAVPATVGVICISAGVNYALSKIRGVLGWA